MCLAEDILHTPSQMAAGQLQALGWESFDGRPALRAAGYSDGLYTSPVIQTRLVATHFGVHWRAEGPQASAIRFELRTSADGTNWSPWRATWLESEPSEDPRNGESFAALVWAGDARFVQYRATLPGRSDDAPALRYVVLTALSAAPPSAQLAAARTAKTKTPTAAATPRTTGTPKPTATSNAGALDPPFAKGYLLSREDWGADESLRYDPWGQEVWPRMYVPTKKIIVHHTAGLDNSNPADPNYPYPSYTPDQAVQEVRGVYYYHAITHGWGDIGYNALIDRFGRVYEGRRGRDSGPHGGREIISPDVVAGHALNCNEGATGVSLVGNFDVNQLGPTEQANMVPALLDFLTWSCRRFYISPTGSSDFLEVDWVLAPGLSNIIGHRDVNQTACPGQYVYPYLPDWRQQVAAKVAQYTFVPPSVQITKYPTAVDVASGSVSFTWKSSDSSSALFSYYLEGWIPNLDNDTEYYVCGFTGDKRPDWSAFSSDTTAKFTLPMPARYTFHVRAKDPKNTNEGAFDNNWTFVSAQSGPTIRKIGVPGVVKN
jgi:hypothetical protein